MMVSITNAERAAGDVCENLDLLSEMLLPGIRHRAAYDAAANTSTGSSGEFVGWRPRPMARRRSREHRHVRPFRPWGSVPAEMSVPLGQLEGVEFDLARSSAAIRSLITSVDMGRFRG